MSEIMYPSATEAQLHRLRVGFQVRAAEILADDPGCCGRIGAGALRKLAIEAVDGVGMTLARRTFELLDQEPSDEG